MFSSDLAALVLPVVSLFSNFSQNNLPVILCLKINLQISISAEHFAVSFVICQRQDTLHILHMLHLTWHNQRLKNSCSSTLLLIATFNFTYPINIFLFWQAPQRKNMLPVACLLPFCLYYLPVLTKLLLFFFNQRHISVFKFSFSWDLSFNRYE